MPTPASHLRKPAVALAALCLIAVATVSLRAESWEQKDWTQWTSQDCYHILSASAWAQPGPELFFSLPGATRASDGAVGAYFPVAVVVSSLVVRQALERQAQFDQHYEKMSREQRQAFDQTAAACIGKKYGDRIIIRVPPEVAGPFRLEINGQYVPSLPQTQMNAVAPCPGDKAIDVSFPDVDQGKQIIQPGDKKIEIKNKDDYTFTFNADKMIYKGKLDY